MDPEQDTPDALPENELEAGLRAVFSKEAAPPGEPAIEPLPRILLRDEDSEHGSSPLVDASSPEARQAPVGRANLSVLGEIARGGVGVILKGRDNDLGRDIAIKVLREEHAHRPFVLHRFVEEAQIGGQLQHPGVVPVYQLGSMPDGRPFFAMKLVKGRTLAELLLERSAPHDDRARFVAIFGRICQTVAYAHSRGVIHRDLKPANVMVGAFGEVQVVDWGLAKVLGRGGVADEERARSTEPTKVGSEEIETVRSRAGSEGTQSLAGSVMGTPAYMPPEQASGDPDLVDERSDVFALGGILCEVLTGTPPYRSEQRRALVSAATAQLADALERLEQSDADAELIRIARSCLAPAREDRPRNAEVVSRAIDTHQRSVEERAQQDRVDAAEARVKAVEERRARKLTVILGSTILASLLAAGIASFASMEAASRRRQRTRDNVGAALTQAASHRALGSWDDAHTSLRYARTLAGDGEDTADLRDRIEEVEAELRQEEWVAAEIARLERENLELVARVEEVRPPEGAATNSMAWVPVGDVYAAIFEDYGLSIERDSVVEAADKVHARGIPLELASLLDVWAAARRRGGSRDRSAHLTRVALEVDGDPLRSELRRALLEGDVPARIEIARRDDLHELPGLTLNLLGAALADARAWEEAIAVARVTCAQHPDDLGANLNLALLYRRATPPLPAEAIRYYTAALALRPESVEVRHQLAITLGEELHRHAEAADTIREALRWSPDDAHLLLHLGESLFALGDVSGAVVAFRDCVANEPPGGTSAHHFAWLLANAEEPARRDLASAIEFADHATSVYAYDASAWDTLAVIRYQAGDWSECIAALERSMELTRGGDAYPWFYVSASHARLGDPAEARIWFDRAVEWMEEHSTDSEELADLRAEASSLLDGGDRD